MRDKKINTFPDPLSLPSWLQNELRSDHAGELGAVWIYKGILQLSHDSQIKDFAQHHLQQEQQHLAFFEEWLPTQLKSRLVFLWKLSGWLLGCIAVLMGKTMVYSTIDAVERFVVSHYAEQISQLNNAQIYPDVVSILKEFELDEERHRQEALQGNKNINSSWWMIMWQTIIIYGSRQAVFFARRI